MLMTLIIHKEEILSILGSLDLVTAMKEAFIALSNGKAVVPPVGELLFDRPKGETHIKYGYLKGDDFYVIKIASGFYENPRMGLDSSQGMMLIFSQKTGEPIAILLDGGKLTDIRTAAAGALVARHFAPKHVKGIGILGTGTQARLQLQYLLKTVSCGKVWIWGRNESATLRFKQELKTDLEVQIASSPSVLAQNCNLIVTTTPSSTPLLFSGDIQEGTHITAVGSDTSEKQELDCALLKRADLLVSDSLAQSQSRGEVFQAFKQGSILKENIIELGHALQDSSYQRVSDKQLTIVDLTGVAVQDIAIAKSVYLKYLTENRPQFPTQSSLQ